MTIPVMKPRIPSVVEVVPYLRKMDERRIYSNLGPLSEELRSRLAKRFEVQMDQVTLVNNATAGLAAAMWTAHRGEWLVPDFTFTATGLAVRQIGASLRLADVDATDWFLELSSCPETSVNTGVVPVMPFGRWIDRVSLLDRRHVVVDAAAAFGTSPSLGCVNGQFEVPGFGQVKVPGLRGGSGLAMGGSVSVLGLSHAV